MAKANLKVVSDEALRTDENLRFAHLPISELRASEDNRKVGDVSDLVASIKEIGVIQPITVTPIEGGYQIVFGHRRVEAARKAGLREIPAIVREVSERERLEQSLIENLQREDLTPYEEALAYDRLLSLKDGPSQRQLATLIARSQSHISKRLQLLKLPESVIEKLDSGGITIEDAMALAELVDVAPPEEVEAVLEDEPYDIPSHVDLVIARRSKEAQRLEAIAALEKQGVEVIEWPEDGFTEGVVRLLKQEGAWYPGVIEVTPSQHRKEPCHAATVDPDGIALYVCTGFGRHQKKGESKLKSKAKREAKSNRASKETTSEAPDQDRELKKKRKEALEAREAALSKLIDSRLPAKEVSQMSDLHIVRAASVPIARIACELLGLEVEGQNHSRVLVGFARSEDRQLQRAARAVVFASAEEQVRASYSWETEIIKEHFELLGRHGYSPAEVETAYLREVSERHKEAQKISETTAGTVTKKTSKPRRNTKKK